MRFAEVLVRVIPFFGDLFDSSALLTVDFENAMARKVERMV